jgi:hypothetical protein
MPTNFAGPSSTAFALTPILGSPTTDAMSSVSSNFAVSVTSAAVGVETSW